MQLELRVDRKTAGPSSIIVDDIILKDLGPASVACPTETPTITPSPTEEATATSTATPVDTVTSTPIASPTASPVAGASATPSPPATGVATATPIATTTPTASPVPPSPSATSLGTSTAVSPTAATPAATHTATASPSPEPPAAAPTGTPPPAPPTPSNGLLINGGFEDADGAGLIGWHTIGGVLSQVDTPVHGGGYSAAFFSSTSSTKWVFQTVAVEPLAWYQFDGFVYHDDPWVDQAFLRVSWYESADGAGSAIDTVDSTHALSTPSAAFRSLTTGPVRAPANAHSARVRVVMRPFADAGAVIYIDDVSFAPAATPPTVTPVLTMTPSPTPTATATATMPPDATPTLVATSTRTPTEVVGPTATVTSTAPPASPSTPSPPATPDSESTATATLTPAPTDAVAVASGGLGLLNGSFEAVDGEAPAGWDSHGGVLGVVDDPVRSGAGAGAFYSATDSTKWVYQTLSVEPLGWYEMHAFIYQNDPWVQDAFLRVSWYASDDGSGSAIATSDSTEVLGAPSAAYRLLSTGPVRAPPGVHSANARIMLRPKSGVAAVIYIDDVSFERAAQPPAPADEPAAAGSASTSPSASSASSGSTGSTSSQPVSQIRPVAQPPAPVYTPQPLPIIRRNPLVSPVEGAARGDSTPWWSWALLGASVGMGVVGWGMYGVRTYAISIERRR